MSIKVDLPRAARISLKVYDIIGRELRALVSETDLQPGSYTYQFNASSKYASGMYIYRLIVDGKTVATKRMVLMK